VPKQTEVLVIGGGLIGSFVAYWMRSTMPSFNVTVIERLRCKYSFLCIQNVKKVSNSKIKERIKCF